MVIVETFVPSGPLSLWTGRTGDHAHPAVLLIMGAAAPSVTCPEPLAARLVDPLFPLPHAGLEVVPEQAASSFRPASLIALS